MEHCAASVCGVQSGVRWITHVRAYVRACACTKLPSVVFQLLLLIKYKTTWVKMLFVNIFLHSIILPAL